MRHSTTARACATLIASVLLNFSTTLRAQPFTGTNSPGQSTAFSFTMAAGATNLVLSVSNTAAAYSYLYLKAGGAASQASFDFVSRLDGQNNQIALEAPEFAVTNYGLLVFTPAASATDSFTVLLGTSSTNLRAAPAPALKPPAFSTTGSLTNNGPGAYQYFQVDVPANGLPGGWRVVLNANGGTPPELLIKQGQPPTQFSYDHAVSGQQIETLTYTNSPAGGTYFIGVFLPAGTATNTTFTLGAETNGLTVLAWDPGQTDGGTKVYTNQSSTGGDYYFEITTASTAVSVWRTVLTVQSGEADLYLNYGSLPSVGSSTYFSKRTGSDGLLLAQGPQFSPGQNWYILVHATPGAQWSLFSGQAYVQPLPPLAADSSSGATNTIGPEGMRFFSTTIPASTLAWRLGLGGPTNLMYVKQNTAPLPYSTATYDLAQSGQMLVVPPYLTTGGQYFVGVAGDPGTLLQLDSRQQAVTPLSFASLTNFSATTYGYVTFVVQVPVQQIAWQLIASAAARGANVAVRRGNVPNEFVNDAFSESPGGGVASSVSLVPPTLSNGSFYVTVYGAAPYTCSLSNGQPVITDVDYVFQITNDAPRMVGWRYYRVVNTAEQLGTLGWELDLANQPPGAEIAIRRNAVPGQWNYRNDATYNYNYTGYSSTGFVDFSSALGFLQQPNHQADVWYIGVYSPAAALGNFALSGSELTGPPLAFDGAGGSATVTNQPAGKFQYFQVVVPTNALGWDVRIVNVTGGDPRLVVGNAQLPNDLGTHGPAGQYFQAITSPNWPSGYQWAAAGDWTGTYYDANGTNEYGHVLAMGMGNPLQPGTYYVGVLNGTGPGSGNPMSYTLQSRGIGPGFVLPVNELPFTNGVAHVSGLPGREAAYYHVAVPTNAPDWKLALATNSGQVFLLIQQNSLPNLQGGYYAPTTLAGGREMSKAGSQQYLLMPGSSAGTNIPAGDYYLAVVSDGQNPSGSSYLGTGTADSTLTSFGVPGITNLGTVDPTGATDLFSTNSNLGGEIKTFQFTVPSNTLSIEVHLDNVSGGPVMTLRADGQFPGGTDPYGENGGQSYTWTDHALINVPNPAATNYTLMVQAGALQGVYPDSAYTVRVHALTAQPIGFANTTLGVTNQSPGTWRFFSVVAPPGALGWDIRVENATSGDPRLVVCRDLAPYDLYTHGPQDQYFPAAYMTNWPSGYQWAAAYDWTGDPYDANGTNAYGHILAMGMGNPLEPGAYYVGVLSGGGPGSAGPMSYTLRSRGIGGDSAISVVNLAFTNGTASVASLAGREAAYYRVVVPTNAPAWKLELATNAGQTYLVLQQNALPSCQPGNAAPTTPSGGRLLDKSGDQQYLLMPGTGQTNIPAGTYYLAAASAGMNPNYPYLGTNSSAFTLTSFGIPAVTELGTVDSTGATDIFSTNSNLGGEIQTFQFSVPPGTLNLEVYLENTTGNPVMSLRADPQLPGGSDLYGQNGGQGYTWNSSSLITIASPPATNYTLMVQAAYSLGLYPDANYTLRLHAIGTLPITFDGGTYSVTNQPPKTWQYFVVTVPQNPLLEGERPQPALSNAFGWDVRITNVTSGDPRLVVCRDQPPSDLGTHGPQGQYWPPTYSSTWPGGYEWAAVNDWTGTYYDANGTNEYGHVLAMGMGNPLQPGTYYVGVYSGDGPGSQNPMSYSVSSRGIGPRYSIPLRVLTFTSGFATNLALPGREADYYMVAVPSNAPDWKLRLTGVSGQSYLALQEGSLPSSQAGNSAPTTLAGGLLLQKPGNEQYLLLPASGSTNIPGGMYFAVVPGAGINPANYSLGTNSSSYFLESYGVENPVNLGTVAAGADLYDTNSLQGGEDLLYQFTIPAGEQAVEVRLDNTTAYPYMTLAPGPFAPSPAYPYGYNGGVGYTWSEATVITLPNPAGTNYTLTVQAAQSAGQYLDADFTVHVRQMPVTPLNISSVFDTNGAPNAASGSLANGQSAFYEVVVPASYNGGPVLGWKLDLAQSSGTPELRVRKDLLPDNNYYGGTSPWATTEAIIVPPYLTNGVWYVEVMGQGASTYTLTSSFLTLDRPAWSMPSPGSPVTTPGLPAGSPLFADTGVDTNGVALPGDQGTDLAQGSFDYYALIVPPDNIGLVRMRLDAISGNPNLYIREGFAPTLTHGLSGQGGTLFDRSITAVSGSEYGNWVPVNGRFQARLNPGVWYVAVRASGNSNVRYRLRMDTGNLQTLALNGGVLTNQQVVAGDWGYYQVYLPTNAPQDWQISFSEQLGSVHLYIRDTAPPGFGSSVSDLQDWATDNKNYAPAHPMFANAGSYTVATPPLRPGSFYYLGFYAQSDATFSVSSGAGAAFAGYTNTIAFYNGYTTNNIPPQGLLTFRIDVPPEAVEWIDTATHAASVWLFLEQGTLPTMTTFDNFYAENSANSSLTEVLTNRSWPWVAGCSYYLAVTNTSAQTQPFSFYMDGVPPNIPAAYFISVATVATGFQMTADVYPGQNYYIQVSADLATWYNLAYFIATGPTYTYVDTGAPGSQRRFYRLMRQ